MPTTATTLTTQDGITITTYRWRVHAGYLEDPEVVCYWCAYPEDGDITHVTHTHVTHDKCLNAVEKKSKKLEDEQCFIFCKDIVGDRIYIRTEPVPS